MADGSILSNRGTTKRLKPRIAGRGYHSVSLGAGNYFYVHQIVWLQFKGEIPNGLTINHIDGNKTNNAISNLELLTKKDNSAHGAALGLFRRVKNEKKVKLIKSLLKKGLSQNEIARQVGWTQSQISYIKREKIYQWVV